MSVLKRGKEMANNTNISLRNQVMYSVYVRNHSESGDFKGLMNDLDRIKDMGVDVIWLMPIHPIGVKDKKGSLGCPYSISDYRGVNPAYGTKADFVELVDKIHEKGMKCIIDVVYNHTSRDSVLLKEHPEFFYRREDGSFGNKVGDWSDVYDLDYNNRDLWTYQIDTLKMWAEIVDGFRCDVAPLVPIEFWKMAREECSKVKADLIWLAESTEVGFIKYLRSINAIANSDNTTYEAFDITYDYDIWNFYRDYLEQKIEAKNFAAILDFQDGIYPENYVKIRGLENHDQPRVMSYIHDEEVVKRLLAFSFFQKGMAFLYAGEEYGNDKVPSLFEIDRIDTKTGIDLCTYISKLSEIKRNPIFKDALYSVSAIGDTFIIKYNQNHKVALGIFNIRTKASDIRVEIPDGSYINAINGQSIKVDSGIISSQTICDNNGVIEIII